MNRLRLSAVRIAFAATPAAATLNARSLAALQLVCCVWFSFALASLTVTAQEPQPPAAGNGPTVAIGEAPIVPTGSQIHGHLMTDPADGNGISPIPNAKVELSTRDGRVIGRRSSNASGYYSLPNVPQGDYDVVITRSGSPATRRSVQVAAQSGAHVLDFLLRTAPDPAPDTSGTLSVSVFEKSGADKIRRTDATVLIWRADDRKSLSEPDAISGEFTTTLPAGQWSVNATVAGLTGIEAQAVTIVEGETIAHEIVLEGGEAPRTSAVVSIAALRRDGDASSVSQLPVAQFVGKSGTIACLIEPASAAELPGGNGAITTSRWLWFTARPSSPLAPGAYQVTGNFSDYPTATTSPMAVVAGTPADFTLTFRPSDLQGQVHGTVLLQEGESTSTLAGTTATIAFENPQSGESRSVTVGADGTYTATMPPGTWWASADAPGFPTSQSALVVVKANEQNECNLTLRRSKSTADPTITATAVVRIQMVDAEIPDDVQPQVWFRSRQREIAGELRMLTDEERQAFGIDLIEDSQSRWRMAMPKEPLVPGVWTATAEATGFDSCDAEKILRKGASATFHLNLAEQSTEPRAELRGKVVHRDGQPVGSAEVRLWSDNAESRPVVLSVDASGNFSATVKHGTWWLDASALGLTSSGAVLLMVDGDREQNVTLFPGVDAPLVSAIVSVKRMWNQPIASQPKVVFYLDEQPVESELRVVADPAAGSGVESGWDMFEAIPLSASAGQACRVTATLEGYVAAETETQVLQSGATSHFDMTLRPNESNPGRLIRLTGQVYRKTEGGQQEPFKTADVFIRPVQRGNEEAAPAEPLVASQGAFQTDRPTGCWELSAVDPETNESIVQWIVLGSRPMVKQDLMLPSPGPTPPPHQLVATIEVVAPDANSPPPQVVFIARNGKQTSRLKATVVALETTAGLDSHYYQATAMVESEQAIAFNAMALVDRQRYRVAASGFQPRSPGPRTTFCLIARPKARPIEPGRLVGCVLIELGETPILSMRSRHDRSMPKRTLAPEPIATRLVTMQPPAEPIAMVAARTAPLRDVTLTFLNQKTRQRFEFQAENGCFDLELPPGDWVAAVRGSEMKRYTHPAPITISEGQLLRQDIVIPAPAPPQPAPALVEAVVAVHRKLGFNTEDIPSVQLVPCDVAGEPMGESLPMLVRKLTPAEVEASQLVGFPVESGSWDWFVAATEGSVDPKVYKLQAELAGYESLLDATVIEKFAVPGTTTRFDAALAPFLPKVEIRVVDTEGKPRPGLTVRLIQNGLGFDSAIKGTTDRFGAFQTSLSGGVGRYQTVIGGDASIEAEPIELALFERDNRPAPIVVYGKGEMRKVGLEGILVGVKPEVRTRNVIEGGKEVTVAYTVYEEVRLGDALVRLEPMGTLGLASNLRLPISPDAEGRFAWQDVPEGDYRVRAEAEGFHPGIRKVTVSRDNTHASALVPFKLDPVKEELENAVRQILTAGWRDLRNAKTPYETAVAYDPNCITPDLALAMAMLHAKKVVDATNVLTMAASAGLPKSIDGVDVAEGKHIGLRGKNQSFEWHCANELRLYLLMQRKQLNPAMQLLEQLATVDYSRDAPYFDQPRFVTPATQEMAYLMGVSCGVLSGPWSEYPETERFPQRLETIRGRLADCFRDSFERGFTDAMRRFHELDTQFQQTAVADAANAEDQRQERLEMIEGRLEEVDRRMADLNAEEADDQRRAQNRINEIDQVLGPLINQAEQWEGTLRNLNQQIAVVRQQLDNTLRQMQQQNSNDIGGGGGGFQGGGFRPEMPQEGLGQGGFGDEGFGQGGSDRFAELERQLRTELLRLGRQWDNADRQLAALVPRIQTLEANRQAVINAYNQSAAQRGTEFRQLEVQRPQLQNGVQAVGSLPMQKSAEVQRMERERLDFPTYFAYPLEQRRQQILELCGGDLR